MRGFDELNIITGSENVKSEPKARSVPYEKYFGAMNLTKEQKRKRVQFSDEFEEDMLFIFAYYLLMKQNELLNKELLISQLASKYLETAEKYVTIDDYMQDYIQQFAKQIIETTIDHDGDEYYTSSDRAAYVAENEANSTLNYGEYDTAIKNGYTKKRWVTEGDERVRETHREVDGQIIPIKEPFVVGDSLLFAPKVGFGFDADAKEVVNCRCSIEYYR